MRDKQQVNLFDLEIEQHLEHLGLDTGIKSTGGLICDKQVWFMHQARARQTRWIAPMFSSWG